MDLARQLGRLLDDAGLRERLAEAGYDRVRARHPASAARRRLLEAYARLLPPSEWAKPASAVSPIDALPSRPDTTTSRRPMPQTMPARRPRQGRAVGRDPHSAPSQPEQPVVAGEIVIEIDAPLPDDDLLRDVLEEAFGDEERVTGQFVAVAPPLGFESEAADEKTEQRPLRPKKTQVKMVAGRG